MKKNLIKFAAKLYNLIIFGILSLIPKIASAQTEIDKYIPRYGDIGFPQYKEELQAVEQLPGYDLPVVLSMAANILIGVTGSIAVVGLIVAGVLYVTAHGNDQQTDKAKSIILYIVIGLAVVAASYAIILGISSLSFD